MAANPRKFSEKIALMRAKEAEADAAFHQILNEVSGITKAPETQIPPYSGLKNLIPHASAPYAPFKTGSLPNINHSLQQQLQQQQSQQQRQCSPGQQLPSPHAAGPGAGIDLKSAIHDLNSLNSTADENRRRFLPPQYGAGGNAPGMRPQRNRISDHVTYSPYLTPHPLNGPEWKKFKSDSDIHGSIKQHTPTSSTSGSPNSGIISPMIHRRVLEVGGNPGNPGNAMSLDMRAAGGNNSAPGKFVDGPGFPPVNGMPPVHLSMGGMPGLPPPQQMSMSHPSQQQHHGSLPDLSNLGFNNSPAQHNSNPGPCSPPNDGYGRMVSTSMPPPDSPSSIRPNGSRQQSPLVGSPTQIKQIQGVPHHFQYFPQPMPGVPMHISQPMVVCPPPQAGAPLMSNANTMSHSIPLNQQQPQQQGNQAGSLDKQLVNETIRRRISDKLLAQQQAQQYRQSTDNVPSPSSPGTPPVRSPDSGPGNSQHGGGAGDGGLNYALSPGSHSSLQQQFDQVNMDGGGHFTNGNLQESPFIHDHRPPMKHQHSIPNIVLTGADDNNYSHYFDKDFRPSMGMSDSFDANDMFSNDEQFKTDLTPLDLEGLQMLEDPTNVLTDPSTEDQLRLCG